MKLQYEINKIDSQQSIHHFLRNELKISTRLLTKLIKYEKILVNKNKCHTKNLLKKMDL